MSVADKLYFTKENIERNRFNASSVLAEQAVHCLELVAELASSGLSFQFKGGNSLLIILGEPKRFSIDVDIASDRPREEIEAALDKIVARFGTFTRWERRQHKTKPWLPLSSYLLYYNGVFDTSPNAHVMFDVQMRRSPYKTEFKKVRCGNVYQADAKVELPVPSSIIADKLLTLGPATLGIPIGRGKEAQRLKHVYDVSRIAATLPDVAGMREVFHACLRQENDLQETCHTAAEVVKDTLSFLYTTAKLEEMPESSDIPALSETIRGLEPFAGHLFDAGYDWRSLRRDMARAALCISAVGNEKVTDEMLHKYISDAGATVGQLWDAVYAWWDGNIFW